MNKRKGSPTFKEIEAFWYEKLKSTGFVDIENTADPERPLNVWHSFKYTSKTAQIRKERRAIYQQRIDIFAQSREFSEIINLIVKHGNSRFSNAQVTAIWDMHRHGITERGIAAEMDCSKSCIHFLLHRIKAWMKLV